MKDFIEKEIEKYLISIGLDKSNAKWCAIQGADYYSKKVCNSKDPFKDSCDYAGLRAEERSLTFKYKSPKPKRKQRSKRPQDAFNFNS